MQSLINTTNSNTNVTPLGYGIEVILWAIMYATMILNGVVPSIRKLLMNSSSWAEMSKRKGQVLNTMAEEAVLTLSNSTHHIFGGLMMLLGQQLQDEHLWLHGMMVEIGFEITDLACLFLRKWPYSHMPAKFGIVTIFHHIPGLVAAPSLIMGGYHRNQNLMMIGWALLLAGGVSLLTEGLKQTRSMSTQLGQWLSLHVTSLCGVIFARFYIFPLASIGLLKDISEQSPDLYNIAMIGIGSMAFFNICVLVILSEKLIKYGWIYFSQTILHRNNNNTKGKLASSVGSIGGTGGVSSIHPGNDGMKRD
jgi:hypothetical protein